MKDLHRPKQSSRRVEAELCFMLGGQALNRWTFRLEQLQQRTGNATPGEQELLVMEARLGMQQMASLAKRMDTFTRSRVLPIRFEAQEMLVAANRIAAQLAHVQQQLTSDATPRPAQEVATALLARAKRGNRRRPGVNHGWREDAASAFS